MGLLSFSRPSGARGRPAALLAPIGYEWNDNPDVPRDGMPPPRFCEPLIELGPTLTVALLEAAPKRAPIPAPTRTPGNHPIGTRRPSMPTRRRPMSTYTNSLPPGAAPPAFGNALEYRLGDTEILSHPSVHLRKDSRGRAHVRAISMSVADSVKTVKTSLSPGKCMHDTRTMSRTPTGAPVVPPRSHLRALAANGNCQAASSTSPSPSPSPSGRASPKQYVLAVEPPTATFSEPPAEATEDVFIHRPQRKSTTMSPGKTTERDPFKVRDSRPPRKSSSGVYTPNTFPGAGTRPAASTSAPTSPSDAVSRPGGARQRTLSGFKRLSMALNAPAPPLPAPARNSSYHPSRSGVYTPSSISFATASSYSHSAKPSYSSQASTSPSSASIKSMSPPATPITPTSGPSYIASNGVVVITAENPRSSLEESSIALEPTPKASPHSTPANVVISQSVSGAIAERNVPLSPDAPRRARRKPVPRIDEFEADLTKRLEAVQF